MRLIPLLFLVLPSLSLAEPTDVVRVTFEVGMPAQDDAPASWSAKVRLYERRPDGLGPDEPLWSSPDVALTYQNQRGALEVEIPRAELERVPAPLAMIEIQGVRLVPAVRVEPVSLAFSARTAQEITGTAHCDCVRVDLEDGTGACTEGRSLAGLFSECTEASPCVTALHCCRVCRSPSP